MTLADKRTFIEALLCASDIHSGGLSSATYFCRPRHNLVVGKRLSADVYDYHGGYGYEASCVDAAYRLIESSPTLRREWFGAR